MSKRKYTIENIKNFLEEFGFDWSDKTIFDSQTNKYRKFKDEDYRKHALILYLKNASGAYFNAMCVIDDSEFEIIIGKQKMDLSSNWQIYLTELNTKVLP